MTSLLRDRYEPLEVVGQGGEGRVVRAWDHLHGRPVAVKVRHCRPERADILSEARVLLDITPHRLLPLVRDDFFSGDDYCLVLDWVEGESLASLLSGRGSPGLPFEDVVVYLRQVAEALDHLHSHSPPVVHGDVKPANVVVVPDGRAILVDFGISGCRPTAGTALGTRGFVAPEAATGSGLTPAADVFGLAATAFALLTGTPPAPGSRPRWRALVGDRAHQVELVLRRGLAYDPARRPARASDLVAALARGAGGRTNLPLPTDSFVGREREAAALADDLAESRLVTLGGPGGIGKSRLATQFAAGVLSEYHDGVYLVELAGVSDPAHVPAQVAAAVGVVEQPGERLHDTLAGALGSREMLLVLDNCEHVLDAAAALLEALLRRGGRLRVLATSREPLGVDGERVRRLPPMSEPESAQLFVERASAARPGMAVGKDTGAVREICRHLDGMPLALELAAAQTRSLSVADVATRVDDRFDLLAGGPRRAPARHRSLAAVVDWSYDALPPSHEVLFRRLSVFAGSFTRRAAEEICSGNGIAEVEVADLLSSLVDRSLVVAADDDRYRLLETLREYGAERLARAGEAETSRSRHLEWFQTVAASRPTGGPDSTAFLAALEADHDNCRAALRWALGTGRVQAAADLACSLRPLWDAHAHHREAGRWFEQILEAGVMSVSRVRILTLAGAFAQWAGDFPTALMRQGEALALSRDAGDHGTAWDCLRQMAETNAQQDQVSLARRQLEEAEASYRTWGPGQELPARLLNAQAIVAHFSGDVSRERLIREEMLARAREDADEAALVDALVRVGQIAEREGVDDRARFLYEEGVWRARRTGSRKWLAVLLASLGRLARPDDDPGQAEELLIESFDQAAREGRKRAVLVTIASTGVLAARSGAYDSAARLLGGAAGLGRRARLPLPGVPGRRAREKARAVLGDAAFEAAHRTGEAWSEEEAVSEALTWLERSRSARLSRAAREMGHGL